MRIKQVKKLSLLVMALGFSCAIMAQEALFSQYMFNRMSFNPGYAGSSGSICASAIYRNQWMGLSLDKPTGGSDAGSTPTEILLTFDMPVKFLHGGFGFTVVKNSIGYHDNFQFDLNYAFRMFWGDGNLSAGVALSYLNSSIDLSQLHGIDPNDPMIGNQESSANLIDGNVGIYYQVPGRYYLGLSVKNILGAHSDEIQFTKPREVYAMGGYEYTPASAPSIRIKPSVLLKTANFSYFSAEASCLVDYRNAFWGGAGYRVGDALFVMAGVHKWKTRLGVCYDFTTSRLGGFKPGRSFGSFEVYLKYCFKVVIPQKPPTSYGNSIYLL